MKMYLCMERHEIVYTSYCLVLHFRQSNDTKGVNLEAPVAVRLTFVKLWDGVPERS